MKIKKVDTENRHVYDRLIQYYECEFSSITHKKPDNDGFFSLDTELGESVLGFISLIDDIPAGFAAIRDHGNHKYEVCEFFVVPCFRRNRIGSKMAETIWIDLPGMWEVKQIEGADYAVSFWRRAISQFTSGRFKEDVFTDEYWGKVTRQSFTSKSF